LNCDASVTLLGMTEVTLQNIRPVSDSGPHLEVAQIRIQKIRFHVLCAVHTVKEIIKKI